jgi:SHS2 domain-containing protein
VKNYEILEHTADIRIRIKSRTLKCLFRRAWLAIIDITVEKQKVRYPKEHKIAIRLKAGSVENLFINWLNELLSISAAKALIFNDIKINKMHERFIEAVALGADIRNYKMNIEVKAATYHQLKVKKSGSFWKAEVILDV